MIKQILAIPLFFLLSINLVQADAKVDVGVSTPLTGLGSMGTDIKNALVFANQKFFNNKYNLIIEDDKCEKKAAIAAAQKLTNINRVKYVIGQICNSTLLASAPVYNKAGTLVIASGATSGDRRKVGSKIFRPYPADQEAVVVLLDKIVGKIKTLAVITEIDEYSMLMQRAVIAYNNNLSPEKRFKLLVEEVPAGSHDFRSILLKLKQKNVDAYFFNAMGDSGYIEMVKQKHTLGITKPHYANILPSTDSARKALGALDQGTVFTNLEPEVSPLKSNSQQIYQEFVSKYGKANSTPFFVLLGMDNLRILDAAINSDMQPEEFLKSTEFQGLSGLIKFDQNGAGTGIKYVLQTIK